jgi:hypothetical protein
MKLHTISKFAVASALALVGASVLLPNVPVQAQATVNHRAITVPWQGDPSLPHQVVSNSPFTLHGVFWDPNNTSAALPAGVSICSVQWDPKGNGTFFNATAVANNGYEYTYTYTDAPGQPYTAVLRVTLCDTRVFTDTMEVIVGPNTRETKVNMAIDRGLWNLHKSLGRGTYDGLAGGRWTGINHSNAIYYEAPTASAVQAYHVNGHTQDGDKGQDPYTDNVRRGLRYLLSTTALAPVTLTNQQTYNSAGAPLTVQNPDGSVPANGIGLTVAKSAPSNGFPDNTYWHDPYQLGQVIDALVSSRTPNAVAETGNATSVKNRAYKDIVQDMLDAYSWGMNDFYGGWHYNWNNRTNDTSASHWWGIGVLAANVWGLDAPAWVKTQQIDIGIPKMQRAVFPDDCWFGYTNSQNYEWDFGLNTTPAGLILMNADGLAMSTARWRCAESYIQKRFSQTLGNFYAMYQTTKAMRTAQSGSPLVPTPKTLLQRTDNAGNVIASTNWYNEYADWLVANQAANGSWSSVGVNGGGGTPASVSGYLNSSTSNLRELTTAWGVIILSPALFEKAPTAVCKADSIVCAAGSTCGAAAVGTYSTANFDGSLSTPGDYQIASYSWDFQDGSSLNPNVVTTHSFAAVGTYNVKLTVTDTRGHSSSATCPVSVTDTALPPLASAGPLGGYDLCVGRTPADQLILDASGSVPRGSNIVSYEWDLSSPIDFAAINATGATTNATALFSALPPGPYNIGVRIKDDSTPQFTTTAFSQVRVRNAVTDAFCNRPPLAVDDAASTFSGVPVTIAVLANDTDPDNNPLTVTGVVVTTPGGTPVLNANGTVTFTPALGFAGVATFKYDIKDSFGAISAANVAVTVTKRKATVTAGSGTKIYGDADPAMSPTSAGFDPVDGITVVQTPRDAGENVGSYPTHASASGVTLVNYDVSYIDGALTITQATPTADATGETVTYDGLAHAGTCTVSGVNGDVLTGTSTYSSGGAPVAAGTHTLTCSFAGDTNYGPASDTADIVIKKLAAAVTAGSGTKTYGDADPSMTPTSSGFLAADGIAVTQTARDPGENVGTYATHATATGAAVDNYDVTYTDGALTITQATPTADATGETVTYDGQPHGGACVVNGVNGQTLPGTSTYSSGGAPVAAGTYTLTCSFAGDDNYGPSTDDATITIKRAAATVTAGSDTKVYGQADPTLTPSSTGFLAADGIVVTQTARDAGENVASYATHATATGAALGNYDVSYFDGSLSITPAPLTITANNVSIHYGVSMPLLTASYSGFQFADGPTSLAGTLTLTTLGTPFTLGSFPIIPSGVTSINYAITFVNGTFNVGNVAPSCDAASGSISMLWAPNHQMHPVTLNGVTDADGDAVTIAVVSIFQDEAVDAGGSGSSGPDGTGVGTSTAFVRAERVGDPKTPGNGRVYSITFSATDAAGGTCTKTVTVGVPHDQRPGSSAVNDGSLFDSTIAPPKK